MNSRINAIPQIEGALRLLESFEYDTKALWAEHHAWLAKFDAREPSEFDATWATRALAPSAMDEHTRNGTFETLTASNCFDNRQFLLTPGQREVLRTRYGLTPTEVVIVDRVQMFPKSSVIWSVVLRSAEHIDPRRRRHVLTSAVIAPASRFFADATALDKEREAALAEADALRVKQGKRPVSTRGMALQYMEG